MRTNRLSLATAVLLALAVSSNAANIVWVSFHPADDTPSAAAATAGFTEAPDKGFTQLLRDHGHQVTRVISSDTPDTNLLNAADLVILSRSALSADYETDAETAAWHGITAPMIVMHGFTLRSNRLGFTTGDAIIDTAGPVRLAASNALHPIFAGIDFTDGAVMRYPYGDNVSFNGVAQRGISLNTNPIAGGGTVLATVGTAADPGYGGVVIAEWPAGATMGTTPADTLGGKRLVFLGGSREDALLLTPEGSGIFNLSPAGADLFLNAVEYMTPPATPNYRAAVLAESPIAYYAFSHAGNTASNSGTLGAAADGVYVNGAATGAEAPRPPQFAGFEPDNAALQLDGTNGYMRSASGLLNSYPNVTLSGWIRRAGTQRNRTGLLGQDNVIEFGYVVNGTLQAWVDNFSTPVNVTNPFPDLEWEHVALAVDGSNLRMTVYTNSQMAGSAALPSANYSMNTNFFVVGGDVFGNNGVTFGGQMDEVAVFTNALGPDRINAHYHSALIRAPAIRRHPQGTNVFAGQRLELFAQASGTPTLRYRWRFNGAPLPQTGPRLVIDGMLPEMSGLYSVTVRNSYGLTQSLAAAVNVVPTQPPTITGQPRSITRYLGRTAAFTAEAAGPNLTYQWQHFGGNLPLATNATLTITNISLADAGRYRAIVSNSTGSTATAEATLTIIEPRGGTYESAILAANPLAYWRLGETNGSTAFDAWGGFDGAYTNVTLAVSGPLQGNTAASFNGASSAVTTPLSLNDKPAFTIVGWFQRAADLPTRTGLWGQNDLIEIGYITNHILQAWTGLPLDINPNPFANGEWVQMAVVSDGSPGTLRIYTNGVSALSRDHTLPPPNFFNFNIGGGGVFDPTGNSFNGRIDDVAVFDHALSAQELAAIFLARIDQLPPAANVSPAVANVPPGGAVLFCVDAAGTGPFEFQWRHNGVNIAGATNACFSITNVVLSDGGNYSVVVANGAGAIVAGPTELRLELPPLQGSDSLTNRTFVGGEAGTIAGTNTTAATDPGEPRHSGKPGGKSVWYEWSSAENGIATFSTLGSTFDTLLGVYVQCGPSNLVEVASDDDGDSNLTSRVRFNVIQGTNYLIAIDGFGGADGQFALNWEFEPASLLPVISAQPENLTVAPGEEAGFAVTAVAGCEACGPCAAGTGNPATLEYQWYRDGSAINGATNSSYTIASAQEGDVGTYSVDVTQSGRSIRSRPSALQLNLTGFETQPVQAQNKFEDAVEAPGIELGVSGLGPPPPAQNGGIAAAQTVVRGYTGTQVFSSAGSTTESGDHPVCGVIGGASQWLTFVPLQSGVLHVNTDGSSYNTVMAIFVRSLTNASILRIVDCDNNGGADGRDSALTIPVEAGVTNFIMVDGVNGQTGTLRLNYSLVISSGITFLGATPEGLPQLRVSGRPELRFVLEASADTVTWVPLLSTNSASGILDVVDTAAPPGVQRMYRAMMLP